MNYSKRFLALMVGLLMATFLIVGCNSERSDQIIYLNFDNTDHFGGMLIREEVKRLAQTKGLNINFYDAKGDSNTQIDQMKEALASNPLAIVLLAIDGDGMIPFVERANEAGIPIVTVNRDTNGGDRVRVYSDDLEAGKLQADFMARNLPQGANIVYLEGTSTMVVSQKRWDGFNKELSAKRPDVHILDMQDGKWSKAEAMKITSLWLNSYPKIDGVVCGNDQMAFGAIAALKEANRLNGCLVTGVDAVDEALEAIATGEMAQTIKQDGLQQAAGVVTVLDAIKRGDKPSDINVPYTSITKDNLVQFKK